MTIEQLALQGKHNVYNSMAASAALRCKEIIRESLMDFQTLNTVWNLWQPWTGGFINDSKATNVNSTWYALESMQKARCLDLWRRDKGNDYNEFTDLVKQHVKAIICFR